MGNRKKKKVMRKFRKGEREREREGERDLVGE